MRCVWLAHYRTINDTGSTGLWHRRFVGGQDGEAAWAEEKKKLLPYHADDGTGGEFDMKIELCGLKMLHKIDVSYCTF